MRRCLLLPDVLSRGQVSHIAALEIIAGAKIGSTPNVGGLPAPTVCEPETYPDIAPIVLTEAHKPT
jgi:hypothetical protein